VYDRSMRSWLALSLAVLFWSPLAAADTTPKRTAASSGASSASPIPAGNIQPSYIADPNAQVRLGDSDAITTVTWLEPGKFEIRVTNTSGIGWINTFQWVPPPGVTITAITSSEYGKCSLSGGNIECTGKIAPPDCTCHGGGILTVNFTATGLSPTFADGYETSYGIVGSYLEILTMTPVPYHIPSFFSPAGEDLPLCKAGHPSTSAKPCAAT
jgi:hypothetical protein